MDRHIQVFQVNSGDFSTQSNDTANDFTNQLPSAIILDKNKDYEVCLYDILFQNEQNIATISGALRNVCVNTNLVESIQNGSESNNTIYTIIWTELGKNSVPTSYVSYGPDSAVFIKSFGNRKWYPLKTKIIFRIEVYLTFEDNGEIINKTPDPSAFTSCSFAIREVGI